MFRVTYLETFEMGIVVVHFWQLVSSKKRRNQGNGQEWNIKSSLRLLIKFSGGGKKLYHALLAYSKYRMLLWVSF